MSQLAILNDEWLQKEDWGIQKYWDFYIALFYNNANKENCFHNQYFIYRIFSIPEAFLIVNIPLQMYIVKNIRLMKKFLF